MAADNGPFQACHTKVNSAAYVVHCVFDVCAMDRDRGTLCKSIQAYAIACQLAGAQIQAWRSSSFCPVSCPANSHYELCSDTCGTSCASLVDSFTCSASCFEGCQCDVGFASDGDKCVSMDTCGCVYEGQYLRVGQVVVTKGCDSKCVCQASGLVRYEKRICASGEVCGVKDEVRGCQLKHGHCMVHPGAHFTTFDCMRGVMGLGAFEVASLCDQTSAQWFRVVVDVRVCSNGAYPNVATVYVFFKDVTVTVNSQHNTWVNGKNVSLTSTPANQLFVSIADRTVVIKRVSGVRVTYSISQDTTVLSRTT
ncbi:IgGFc-binding protein-like [Coregonus clupeaformis]|uniref:IgGFc-binding protein-like n=1 Tax=Coregonus clupeaformis TaxID=59861 RepID=UPI001BE06B2D|nr:IgGFc-binding protein-like [Coregonus clupeaformis]